MDFQEIKNKNQSPNKRLRMNAKVIISPFSKLLKHRFKKRNKIRGNGEQYVCWIPNAGAVVPKYISNYRDAQNFNCIIQNKSNVKCHPLNIERCAQNDYIISNIKVSIKQNKSNYIRNKIQITQIVVIIEETILNFGILLNIRYES